MTWSSVPARYLVTLVVVVAIAAAALVADHQVEVLGLGWCAELCGPSGDRHAYYWHGECDCDETPIPYGRVWSTP